MGRVETYVAHPHVENLLDTGAGIEQQREQRDEDVPMLFSPTVREAVRSDSLGQLSRCPRLTPVRLRA